MLVPTEKLRFLKRMDPGFGEGPTVTYRVLQQWYALDAPSYMRGTEGEWRDVPVVDEAVPSVEPAK